ncbi:MAG TPA: DHA2 family efflux MFS transporter permease subunit [Streptosporangiaceae bacterium]|jgi:EmrB/QacA subfamily drug resistance transporter
MAAETKNVPRGQAARAPGRLDPELTRLALVLLVGAIAALLDTTVVNVSLATIGQDLGAPLSTVQWVLTGYLLAFGMVIPATGWALARFGGKAVWLAALGLFLAASLASAAAWNITSLITFRVVQGIGGGIMIPVLTTLLIQAAGGKNIGRLIATVTLPVVVVPILGPVVGGLIVSHLSWRWIFLINVPLCLAGLVLAARFMPALARPARRPLDLIGLALACPAVAALLYGLSQASGQGGAGRAAVLLPGGIGLVLLAAYVVYALRTSRTPALDLRLFGARPFTGAAVSLFLSGLSMYGAMLLVPLYYQQVRGAGPLGAGLLLAPQGIGSLLPRTVAGRVTDRAGPRPVVLAGILLAALGTLPFALAGAHTSELLLSAALVVRGAGLSTAMIALMAAAYQGLAREQVPDASSATRVLQQVGGSFGTAVLAVILASQAAAHAGQGPTGLALAFSHTFWWSLGFTALAVLPALLLAGRLPTRKTAEP